MKLVRLFLLASLVICSSGSVFAVQRPMRKITIELANNSRPLIARLKYRISPRQHSFQTLRVPLTHTTRTISIPFEAYEQVEFEAAIVGDGSPTLVGCDMQSPIPLPPPAPLPFPKAQTSVTLVSFEIHKYACTVSVLNEVAYGHDTCSAFNPDICGHGGY